MNLKQEIQPSRRNNMKKIVFLFLAIVLLTPTLALAEPDADGCKDHGLFTRMKNYYILECEKKFDQALIMLDEDPDSAKNLKPEGDKTFIRYQYQESAGTAPSYLQIRRNYQNAAKALKGKILVDRLRYTAMQIDKNGARIYVGVELFNDGRNISLTILEQKAMEQEITANDMWEALQKDGFITLYVNFDTNKATIKPESKGIIDQIVELMKSQSNLNISIEGHTDSQGSPAANKTLSLNRAKSVIKAMSVGGINQSRMIAVGWGQEKPVADNRTEEGRAKNRRVEIVKK
jgi:outer membrane protein OmpA-like peptidoglycan-associated protein